MQAKMLKFSKALELLKAGNTLTQEGTDLNTLSIRSDGKFNWKGMRDKFETILEEPELKSLFSGSKWVVNL